ncbi:MAG: His/Gly/Thr/Pro-type tRNA ligase C-terminal domain-containing protein [Parcubacteria group bacterium]|nr:His/Gly/Thr/Pro-type tRNA ligase C-terminal domain-containing protein [Parcubacteria group bacterium]MCR4342356.1 His/Gly/Thr/Pro-type tRNA ligase C-terminal domain-containing protein [Patescibacteria group bacterium]
MLQSKLFTKTIKDAPKDEVSKNASLLIKAGFIDKTMAGVYTYLPLGLRVLRRIENIIRDEMNKSGGVELLMPSMQPKENWEKTGRWETMDDLYKLSDSGDRETALGPTHEEIVVPLVKKFVSSYKDLPVYVYQIQNKFRMELRAKSGILRGREFMMKDLYSFHKDEDDLKRYYEIMKQAYKNIFKRAGIGDETYLTFASGGSFSKYSHEFQTITSAGEDTIYVCNSCKVAINDEIINEQKVCPECGNSNFKTEKAIEVGNIFELKTRFTDAFDLTYKNEDGVNTPVLMGCYGIGLGRLMGTIVEIHNDEKGIIWPENVAPFDVHLILLSESIRDISDEIYESLQKAGVEVLYDERRDKSAGEKFADSDLIGIPCRIVVSEKSMEKGGVELKKRNMEEASIIKKEDILNYVKKVQ